MPEKKPPAPKKAAGAKPAAGKKPVKPGTRKPIAAKTPKKPEPPKTLQINWKAGMIVILIFIIAAVIIMKVPSCKKEEADREYFVEQFGNTAIARIYADGFEELSLKDKFLAYHLYKAALAGDAIAYDQIHRNGLKIKMLLEMIITHKEDVDSDVYEKVMTYAKRFWANVGNYSIRNKDKFLPEFTFDELKEAAIAAEESGADYNLAKGETVESFLEGLRRTIFDAAYEPMITSKNPAPGEDIITASANNFYYGVTLREVEAFNEEYSLNSRIAKKDGHIVEEVYRSGDETIPPGRYAKYIKNIIHHLRASLEYAEPGQKETIRNLIRYYQTGSKADWYKFNKSWVDDDYPVDFINGFIESYIDPRSIKATYESFVFFVDKKTTKMMTDVASSALELEKDAPWKDKYKKTNFDPPAAKSINILIGAGDGGPQSPLGINLPNEQDIRENDGTKSVLLSNVIMAYQGAFETKQIDEFAYSDDEKERARKYGLEAYSVRVALHEVVGHGSGKVSENLEGDPSIYLKEYYSTLEEARAELMALWSVANPILADKKIISDDDVITAVYEAYPRSALVMLRRIKGTDRIEDDHMRATNLIVSYWKAKGSIKIVESDLKFYYIVEDIDDMRDQVGELLAEIMRIKAEGDYRAAKEMVEKYGIMINTAMRDDVVKRCKEIQYPDFTAFVMPTLRLITDDDGKATDVVIEYEDDFVKQMLRWSEFVTVTDDDD